MPFKRLFKDKYAGSSPENASVVRTLFELLLVVLFLPLALFLSFIPHRGSVGVDEVADESRVGGQPFRGSGHHRRSLLDRRRSSRRQSHRR